MKIRIFLALLFLLTIPVFKGTSQSIEIEAVGGTSWRGTNKIGQGIPPFKYVNLYVGSGFNYQILKHSFLTSGLYYYRDGGAKAIIDTKTLNMPFQWSQRYGKKVQIQVGLGMFVAFQHYHFRNPPTTTDPSGGSRSGSDTRFDYGFAATAAVYVPLTKVLAIKAGFNRNWGLTKQTTPFTLGATHERATALFLGLSIKLKK